MKSPGRKLASENSATKGNENYIFKMSWDGREILDDGTLVTTRQETLTGLTPENIQAMHVKQETGSMMGKQASAAPVSSRENPLAVDQPHFVDLLLVQVRAVGAAHILNNVLTTLPANSGMASRRFRVLQNNIQALFAAQQHLITGY